MIPAAAGGFPWESERQDVQLRETVVHLAALRRSGALAGDEISLQSAGDALIIIRHGASLLVKATDHPIECFDGARTRVPICYYRTD